MELEYKPNMPVAESRHLLIIKEVDFLAIDRYLPLGGMIKCT